MCCSDIISIVDIVVDIVVSVVFGIWIANAIARSHTKERFLKDYFTNELSVIKDDCKALFDEICYDKKSAGDIKIGFKILSLRVSSFENNLKEAFKDANPNLLKNLSKIQLEITGSDDYNNQYKKSVVKFSPSEKNTILESRSLLMSEFSKAVIVINSAKIKRK